MHITSLAPLVPLVLSLLFPDFSLAAKTKQTETQGEPATELTVPIGGTVENFTFSQSGSLSYKGKPFNPAVKVRADSVQSFRISLRKDKNFAGAIAEDVDGQNSLYALDLGAHSATPLQKAGTWNGAQKVFWSPSGRYLLALCTYEGQRFVGMDLQTKKVVEGDFLGTEGKLWGITDEPRWSQGPDTLMFSVDETCNPYDAPDCDAERVIAKYSVSLDPATLKVTAKRLK